jgi:hypothetical protein
MRKIYSLIFIFLCAFGSKLWAEPASEIPAQKALILELQQKQENIEKQLMREQKKAEQSKNKMEQAAIARKAAEDMLQSQNNEINQKRLNNAEFNFVLKEREHKRYLNNIEDYQRAIEEAQRQIKNTQQKIVEIEQQANAREQEKIRQLQEQRIADKKLSTEKALREAERKQVLPEANKGLEVQTNIENVVPKSQQKSSDTQEVIEKKLLPEPKAKDNVTAVQLSKEQKDALEKYQQIATLLQEQGLDESPGEYRELIIDAMVDFWIESKRTIQFGYLGHQQYIAEAKLRHGNATFIVGEQRWRYTIPESDDDTRYLFLLDEAADGGPQLHFFRKDLLAH